MEMGLNLRIEKKNSIIHVVEKKVVCPLAHKTLDQFFVKDHFNVNLILTDTLPVIEAINNALTVHNPRSAK